MSKISDISATYLVRKRISEEASVPAEPWPIPSSWKWARMSDIATIVGGGTPKTSVASYFGGDIPWITPADLSGYTKKYIANGERNITSSGLENSGARLMPAGTVLFSSRAPIGYVAIASRPVATNQGFKSFVLKNGLLPDYVYYWLQRAKDFALKLASGTTFLEISGKKTAEIPIPIPPLNEQFRIVAEIEEQLNHLEAGIAALKRMQANLKRYHEAVLSAAIYGDLVGRASEGQWPNREIRSLAAEEANSIVDGPFGSKLKTEHYTASGPRVIRLQNIGDGRFVNEKAHISNAHFASLSKHRVYPGDLVIAALGETLPRACFIPDDIGPAIVKADCIRFKAGSAVLGKYLLYALNAHPTRQATKARMHGIGRPRLNLSEIKSIIVPVPPIAEQHRIVDEVEHRLSVVEELDAQTSADLVRADRLRQSILQKAFTERRVALKAVHTVVPITQ